MSRALLTAMTIGLAWSLLLLGTAWAAEGRPPFSIHDADWRTDFSRHTVPLEEIMSGGPPRDGIPPIDTPSFVSLTDADGWLQDREPVVAIQHRNIAKAYPLQVLIWHEIVNDTIGDEPVTVTFCPLCNSAIVFKRQLDSQVLDFGTTGRLRRSDLVMWDRQVVHDTVGNQKIVVLYSPGTASALDQGSIARSRDIGATGVFIPRLGERQLTLATQGDHFVDQETQSTWNILGKATTGPLAGQQLPPVLHGDHFAFAWLAFKPKSQIYAP